MRLSLANDKVLASIYQKEKLPLWLRYSLWFVNCLFIDWRWARNRATQLWSKQ